MTEPRHEHHALASGVELHAVEGGVRRRRSGGREDVGVQLPADLLAERHLDVDEAVDEAPATSETGEKLKSELDELLDEIDEVLETNAEDFVKSYIQKGGE